MDPLIADYMGVKAAVAAESYLEVKYGTSLGALRGWLSRRHGIRTTPKQTESVRRGVQRLHAEAAGNQLRVATAQHARNAPVEVDYHELNRALLTAAHRGRFPSDLSLRKQQAERYAQEMRVRSVAHQAARGLAEFSEVGGLEADTVRDTVIETLMHTGPQLVEQIAHALGLG